MNITYQMESCSRKLAAFSRAFPRRLIKRDQIMKTMKCVCIYSYGGPEVLTYRDAPYPHPSDGEVVVQVHAAGVNPVDWQIREGRLNEVFHHTLPLILGWDVSGVVTSVGRSGVTRLKVGDEVFSRPNILRDGAYAEFIVIRETEVALKPKSVDHIHAAAIPLAGLTAWQSLFNSGGLSSGQKVLIHAAAGGVGSFAVQLAKLTGAYVIGTALGKNHEFVRKLGADRVIDYNEQRFEDALTDIDLVFDTVGGETQERSWKVLKPGGMLVSIVSQPSQEKAKAHGVREAFVMAQPNADQLAELAKLADSEKLKAIVETVLPLSDATRGQELSQGGHTRGKIVLRVV
jgi:NADPH:quinone reductase-like Zn-dependent oxidoreductase